MSQEMTTDLEKLKSEVLALPPESRAWLAQILIESLDEVSDSEAESLWAAEIHRRDQESRNGTAIRKPASQVIQEAYEFIKCPQ